MRAASTRWGGHSRFPAAQPEELLAGIGEAIDAIGDGFTMRYSTVAIVSRR